MSSVTENSAPSASPAPAASQQQSASRVREVLSNQQFLLLVALALLVGFFGIRTSSFLSGSELNNVLNQFSEIILLAVAETYVIISGGIDLSVGSNASFSGVIGALVIEHLISANDPQWIILGVGTLVCAAAGLAVGLVNATLIHWAKLVPFVATLATLGGLGGLAIVLTHGQPIGLDTGTSVLVNQQHFPFSPTALLVIVIAVLAGIWLHLTRYGRYTFAVGSNSFAARAAGINVRRHLTSVYALSGVLAGLAGMVFYMNLESAAPTAGLNYELQAIAAVVIGGVSLTGGFGRMTGTILGALILTVVYSGLIQLNVDANWIPVAVAIAVAAAASLQALRPSTRRRL
jgi:ribose transport system permease protein